MIPTKRTMAQNCLNTEIQKPYQKEVESVAKTWFTELEQASGPRICNFCDKMFKNKTKCDLHKKIVHCPKIVCCNICQKKCTNELGLRNHLKNIKFLLVRSVGKI